MKNSARAWIDTLLSVTRVAFLMASGLVALGPSGCSLSAQDSSRSENVAGSVQVALQLVPGLVFDSATYVLSGPGAFSRTGSVNIADSATLSFVVGAIPAGDGYTIAVAVTSTDGNTSCTGASAPFAVIAGQVASVPLGLSCHVTSQSGGAMITATINQCPVIDGVSASPAEVLVGGSINLDALAHDADQGPGPLTYSWTATSGVFSDTTAAHTSFACTVAGAVSLTVTVTDGDTQPGCAAVASVTVNCSASAEMGGGPGGSGAGGAGGAAGMGCTAETCTVGEKKCASGSAIQVCAVDSSGCVSWTTVACPQGEVCERHEPASCADPNWAAWPLPGDPGSAWTDNMDNTFTDNVTGLMWQRTGQWPLTHAEAVAYCAGATDANHDGWRLPTLIELMSVTSVLQNGFAVPFLPVYGMAWTSTAVANQGSTFWTVQFISGDLYQASDSVTSGFWAHCVR